MNSIPGIIRDPDSYQNWLDYGKTYIQALLANREEAIQLLSHEDPIARRAAIESFSYIWHCDDEIAHKLCDIGVRDPEPLVRLVAASVVILAHLRCHNPVDRLMLEGLLTQIAQHAGDEPDIYDEVTGYLSTMGSSS